MGFLKKLVCVILMLLMPGIFSISAEEFNPIQPQNAGQKKIGVFDFKETPICDVLKVFTDLTGKNVVVNKEIMKLKITLFLKGVNPQEALKTMCKLYNLWFTEEDNVIRIMSVKDYGKELSVRRDEKTFVYKLKYASCLAVADLLNSVFGNHIEYVEPQETESYSHVGTEKGSGRGGGRAGRGQYSAKTTYYDATYAAERQAKQALVVEKELSANKIEELEKMIGRGHGRLSLEDLLNVKRQEAVVYLSVFPRNNSIVARSVDVRILKEIGKFIEKVDTPTSQVLLECKILEITLTDNFDSFFDFDISASSKASGTNIIDIGQFLPLAGSTFTYVFLAKQIQSRIELFAEDNMVKTIGSPMILCANNAPGEFFIGEERPITTNYEFEIREYVDRTTETSRPVIELREIGTKITVIPSINEDRTVTMRLLVEVASVKAGGASVGFIDQNGNTINLPIDTVDTSKVENIIIAKNNNVLAIGGLIRENNQDHEWKVPLLGDIPLLGLIFKKKELRKAKTETVILISPHIMMAPRYAQAVSDEVMSKLSEHPYVKSDQANLLRYDEQKRKLKTIKGPKEERKKERERRRQLDSERIERERVEKTEYKKKQELSRKKIHNLKKEAKKLYYKKFYPEALSKFKKILELNPQDKTSTRYIKLIHKKTINTVTKEFPKEEAMQDVKDVLQSKQKSRELNSANPEINPKETGGKLNDETMRLYDIATNLFTHGYYEEAKVKFEKIEKLCPDCLKTRYYLGIIPEKIKQVKEKRH